jgi:excisionase family DNA binding protein
MSKLLTITEVAERLRLTSQTIYKMIKRGTLPAIRVGSQWRIPVEKIEQWLESQGAKSEKQTHP